LESVDLCSYEVIILWDELGDPAVDVAAQILCLQLAGDHDLGRDLDQIGRHEGAAAGPTLAMGYGT
jgi:hypothetical protein